MEDTFTPLICILGGLGDGFSLNCMTSLNDEDEKPKRVVHCAYYFNTHVRVAKNSEPNPRS